MCKQCKPQIQLPKGPCAQILILWSSSSPSQVLWGQSIYYLGIRGRYLPRSNSLEFEAPCEKQKPKNYFHQTTSTLLNPKSCQCPRCHASFALHREPEVLEDPWDLVSLAVTMRVFSNREYRAQGLGWPRFVSSPCIIRVPFFILFGL